MSGIYIRREFDGEGSRSDQTRLLGAELTQEQLIVYKMINSGVPLSLKEIYKNLKHVDSCDDCDSRLVAAILNRIRHKLGTESIVTLQAECEEGKKKEHRVVTRSSWIKANFGKNWQETEPEKF